MLKNKYIMGSLLWKKKLCSALLQENKFACTERWRNDQILQLHPNRSESIPLQTVILLCIRHQWRLHKLTHIDVTYVLSSGHWKTNGCKQLCNNFWPNTQTSCFFCLFSIFLNQNTQITKQWLGRNCSWVRNVTVCF